MTHLPPEPPHLGPSADDRAARSERARFAPYELAVVLSHYDLGVISHMRSFHRGSRAAPKVKIRAQRGAFLLKRRAPGRDDPLRVAFCHCVQLELARQAYPVPRLIGTRRDNNSMVQLGGRIYELFEFVEGHRSDGSPAAAARAGEALGRLHQALRAYTPAFPPNRGSFHAADAEAVFAQIEAAVGAAEGAEAARAAATSARELRLAYREAVDRVDHAGYSSWRTSLLHGDWHPGNILYRDGAIVAVLDFDSARMEPRVSDVANGALQFSMRMTDAEDPLQWPEGLDADRIRVFLQGYDSTAEAPLDPGERAAMPWLIIEALVIESIIPIAATGSFARLRGSRFLQMVQRKVAWLRPRAASLGRPALAVMLAALALTAEPSRGQLRIDIQPSRPGIQDPAGVADPFTSEELAAVEIAPRLLELAERLDSDQFAEREEATSALLELEIDRREVYALLDRGELGPEQRHRLLEVLRHRLISAPRGAMGISMTVRHVGEDGIVEIEVTDLVAGLPAQRVLEIGDRIFKAEGEALTSQEDLLRRVQMKRPGESIRLSVRRAQRDDQGAVRRGPDGRPLTDDVEVEMMLASTTELAAASSNPRIALSAAVESLVREARRAIDRYAPPPVKVAVSPGAAASFTRGAGLSLDVVDGHPAIQNLLEQMRYLEMSGNQELEAARAHWVKTLRQLEQQAESSTLRPDEREFYRRLADRFRELMGGGSD